MPSQNTLSIAVCDDRADDRARLIRLCEPILREAGISYTIVQYQSGQALLDEMQRGVQYGLLLLDVMMGEMDGIQLASELRARQDKTQIVFVSCNREMALCGYEVAAARYLAKPVEADKLKEALLYCCGCWQAKKEILLPTGRGEHRTSLADIQYAEAFDRGTRFVLQDEVFEIRTKFSDVEAMLPKTDFLLCHRSFIVNLGWAKLIRHYEFVLKNGRTVPIGKGRYAEIHKTFVEYITR